MCSGNPLADTSVPSRSGGAIRRGHLRNIAFGRAATNMRTTRRAPIAIRTYMNTWHVAGGAVQRGAMSTIFWSWQSDLDPRVTRNIVRDALALAIEDLD